MFKRKISILSILLLLSAFNFCFGQTNSDIDMLRLVAIAQQENRAKIRTWQGHAQIESTRENEDGFIILNKASVDFLSDRSRSVTRWKWTHDKRSVKEGLEVEGNSVSESLSDPINAMITREGYYRVALHMRTTEGEKLGTLVIRPPEDARDGRFTDCFDPMWYLTGPMTKGLDDLIKRVVSYYLLLKNREVTYVTVTRDGNLVILEIWLDSSLNRYTFDLSKKGNIVKYEAGSGNDMELRTWTYEQKDGIWITKTFVFSYQFDKPGSFGETKRTRSVTFVENLLNKSVDVSEFSLEALGYKEGEQVTDRRSSSLHIENWKQRLSESLFYSAPPEIYEELPFELAEPLLGKPLPELKGFAIKPLSVISNKCILLCFFDIEQRPARNCIQELNKIAEELESEDVNVIAIHTSKIEQENLDKWIKENNISFPVGMISENEEQTRFNWGVKSLPWLILTDKQHNVTAEGFALTELGGKIKE